MSTDPPNRWLNTTAPRGDDYDATYRRRAAAGENVHGEADFIEHYSPATVLDAGCGTGRVGIELARRGLDVVGVDVDAGMLAAARHNGPASPWHLADLATVDLGRQFAAIVLAGNVLIFLAAGTEQAVVGNMARHLAPGGVLIAGFQLASGYLTLADYDRLTTAAGLHLAERYATWDRRPWTEADNYAVSVHRHGGE